MDSVLTRVTRQNMIGMAASLLPTELAHNVFAAHFGVMFALYKSKLPILSRWSGSVAGVLQTVALMQLARMYQSNLSAKDCIRASMVDASDIPTDKLNGIGDMTWRRWLSVLLPLPQPVALSLSFPGVNPVQTVTYARVGRYKTTKLKMDVYTHKTTPPNAPILLYIHGGGWVVGDRRIPPYPFVYQLVCQGWVVCSIDYRMSPGVSFPTHLIDAKRAIAYLRTHARSKFHANPDFIAVGGESAGGHLASLVALTPGVPAFQPGFEDVNTSVRGCIDSFGVHDFTDRHGMHFYKDKGDGFMRYIEFLVMQKKMRDSGQDFDYASPMSWLDQAQRQATQTPQSVPPFLVSHGSHDTLVPFGDSALFFEHLQRFRQRSAATDTFGDVADVFMEVPHAHHMFNFMVSPRALAHADAVCVFLENLYQKTKHLPMASSASHVELTQELEQQEPQEMKQILTETSPSSAAASSMSSRL